jgi:lipoate-protein ligase A
LREALAACGVPAVLAEETRFVRDVPATPDCFAANSPNDIVHAETGRKVCGCALKLAEHGVLAQASIPKAMPLADPVFVFRGGRPSEFVPWDSEAFPGALAEAFRRWTT